MNIEYAGDILADDWWSDGAFSWYGVAGHSFSVPVPKKEKYGNQLFLREHEVASLCRRTV